MIDTCQAESMLQKLYSPNIIGIASSRVGEDALSVSVGLCFLHHFIGECWSVFFTSLLILCNTHTCMGSVHWRHIHCCHLYGI